MSASNGKDKALQRTQFRRTLQRLEPKARVDALISETNPKAAVRMVPPEELYRTIQEVGLADTTELVQLASPAQFRTLVDLGAWKKDALDVHELLTWLRAAHGDDDEDYLKKLDGIDMELLELLLRKCTVIHDLEENPDANPPGVTMESPEGKYLIEFTVEGPEMAGLKTLINTIIARDPFAAGRLFEAVRWEIDTELEEEAYKFRAARLQDLGFPELYDALAAFSWVDPDKVQPLGTSEGTALVRGVSDVDFVNAALKGLNDTERDNVEEELRYVANQVLVAEGADPGDLEALKRVAGMARDYLSLGLEHLSGGDARKAPDAVREYEIKRVFQIGFSLALKLKFRVDRMAKAPGAKVGDTWLLLDDETAVVKALSRKRPLKAVKVPGAEPMPFRARRELQETALILDRAEGQRQVFVALLGADPKATLSKFGAAVEVVGPERVFATAVATAILHGRGEIRPVTEAEFAELLPLVVATPKTVKPEARAKAVSALASSGPEAVVASMVDRVLSRWIEEWGAAFVQGGSFDPKLVLTLPIEGMKAL